MVFSLADYVKAMKDGRIPFITSLARTWTKSRRRHSQRAFAPRALRSHATDVVDSFWAPANQTSDGKAFKPITRVWRILILSLVLTRKTEQKPEVSQDAAAFIDLPFARETLKEEPPMFAFQFGWTQSASVLVAAPSFGPDLQMEKFCRCRLTTKSSKPVLEINAIQRS